jgi:hypothetical protein
MLIRSRVPRALSAGEFVSRLPAPDLGAVSGDVNKDCELEEAMMRDRRMNLGSRIRVWLMRGGVGCGMCVFFPFGLRCGSDTVVLNERKNQMRANDAPPSTSLQSQRPTPAFLACRDNARLPQLGLALANALHDLSRVEPVSSPPELEGESKEPVVWELGL